MKPYLKYMLDRLQKTPDQWGDFYSLYLACEVVGRLGPRALTPEAMAELRAMLASGKDPAPEAQEPKPAPPPRRPSSVMIR